RRLGAADRVLAHTPLVVVVVIARLRWGVAAGRVCSCPVRRLVHFDRAFEYADRRPDQPQMLSGTAPAHQHAPAGRLHFDFLIQKPAPAPHGYGGACARAARLSLTHPALED